MRLLISLALLGIIIKGTLCCTCNVFFRQIKPNFCYQRTFVLKAKVVSDGIRTPDGGVYYKIKSDFLRYGNVDTSGVYLTDRDIGCHYFPTLMKDTEYLIMGNIDTQHTPNRLRLSVCAPNKPWSKLTKSERRFLEDPYCVSSGRAFPDYLLLK